MRETIMSTPLSPSKHMSRIQRTRKQQLGDNFISEVDQALRTLIGITPSRRQNPSEQMPAGDLSERERKLSGKLMRVNHCGEICAQALYRGQALTSKSATTRQVMEQAAEEEADHLAWCESRLKELETRKSHLNPAFYAFSFASGMVSGMLGDRINLGFVAATEEQVVNHLEEHIERLPEKDDRSKSILIKMKADEDHHRTSALDHGGADFPRPAKKIMTLLSKAMTRSTYWI
ncbi:MAG: ubiquinone biosynthesis monooxygenase Coq7 [Candidatus Azotimanducaceae bacterium]